jgi:hypothetical protein
LKYAVNPEANITAPTKRSAAENGEIPVIETEPTVTVERGIRVTPAPITIIKMPREIKV